MLHAACLCLLLSVCCGAARVCFVARGVVWKCVGGMVVSVRSALCYCSMCLCAAILLCKSASACAYVGVYACLLAYECIYQSCVAACVYACWLNACACAVVCVYDAPQGFIGNSRLKGVKNKIRHKLYVCVRVRMLYLCRCPAGFQRWLPSHGG